MSVIGPRPALWNQDVLIAEREKYHANDVKPGLTGWAQINGRDELEIPVKAKLDGEYVENAIDMGEFYRVPCDKRDLNYDKYFKEGDVERNTLTEFNSSNTELLDVEQVKEKLLTLQYIRDELAEWENR